MKKHFLILASAACLAALTALSACNEGGDTTDTDTTAGIVTDTGAEVTDTQTDTDGVEQPADEPDDTADTTDVETETDAPAETEPEETTEAVTAAPRYDYMGAEVAPDVTIDQAAYTNMQLTLPSSLLVTDEDVADYIEYIRFQYREADNGTAQMTDQPMKLGDDAYIYYKGMIDGEEFEGGSNWDDESPYTLGLGSGAFIPGFEERLVGVIPANATRETPAEVHVTFPEDYNAELAGKEAIFYVAVEYAVQYTLPEYNRDFVENTLMYEGKKDFYASDKAYLSEFEDYVCEYLESSTAEDLEYAKIDALWNYLTEKAVCRNHPQLELDYYYNAYVDEVEYYYEYYTSYGGTSFTEQYPTLDDFACAYVGVDVDGDWQAELLVISTNMVSKDMIGHAIAEMEGMEAVTDEEYEAELQYWVDYYQGYMTEEEIVAHMGEATIRESAFAAKIQTWLLEQATFTYETEAE